MKILKIKNTLLIFAFAIFLNIQESIAEIIPPTPKGAGGFDDGVVVGGSIDNFIPFVVVIGIIVGTWAMQKQHFFSAEK